MENLRILWVDDEIESLQAFVLFLQEKGYQVQTASNGADAIEMVLNGRFDLILLDEMMPGLDGLTTLREIKKINTSLPIIMATKSEEEGLMDNAIAGQIADYLIKPFNPNQIIMAIKKIFQSDEIRKSRIGEEYARYSSELNQRLLQVPNWQEWSDIYQSICRWDLVIDEFNDQALTQMHFLEKLNANSEFCDYVAREYKHWLDSDERPVMSFDLIADTLIPMMDETAPVYFIVLDCMRLDQYYAIEPFIREMFDIDLKMYYSILPTATPYSRNSIFSGLLPVDIARNFPDYWVESSDLDNSRNRNEHQLLENHLEDLGYQLEKSKYIKIFNVDEGNFVLRKIDTWDTEKLIVLVYNFLDLLAHHRSKSQILKEAIPDEEALRAFTKHWFLHSSFYETLRQIRKQKATAIITTDHGSIRVNRASQMLGDKNTTTTVRYKLGKNLSPSQKNIFFVKEPEAYGLPQRSIVDNYAFAREDYYFVYPNLFHEYMKQYNGTFQHGGVSLEEMILPLAICRPKP